MSAPVRLELVAGGPAWVQDAGRPGRMHQGVPPGGALVPEALAAGNRAVGNPPGAAALEAFGDLVVAARGGDLVVAWDGAVSLLPRDHVRTLARGAAVAYLAVAGGLRVPRVLGGRGLLAVAGVGGGPGRALRPGDRLAVGAGADGARAGGPVGEGTDARRGAPTGGVAGGDPPPPDDAAAWATGRFDPEAPLRVVPGPDLARFEAGAFADFIGQTWTVGVGDRVGTRLSGAPIARMGGDDAPSAPMVRGAVQVPAGGGPIVLGPDHPTTGGYPVLAVLIAPEHGAFATRARGAAVRFRAVEIEEARALTRAWRLAVERGSGGARAASRPPAP